MLTKFFLLLLCISSAATSFSQIFTVVKEDATLRQKITAASKATKTIQSDFVQEKNLSMLAEKLISKGNFSFRQVNQVRLEYTHPFRYLMVISNGKVTIKEENKTTQVDMHKNKLFQQINNVIVDCVQGNALANPNFKTQLSESNTQIKLDMKPIGKGLKDFFSSIVVVLDKKDFSVARMTMNEPSGDNTIITFKNKQLNGTLANNLFMVAK